MNLNLTDIILLLGISQGVFLSISIMLIHERNKSAGNSLSLLLCIATLMLFCRFAVFRIPQEWVWRFGILIDTSIFLFGPIIYIYAKRLLFHTSKPFYLPFYHFLLPIFHLVYYAWSLSYSNADFKILYFSGKLNLIFFIVEALGIISLVYYWVQTFILVKKYAVQEKKELSFRQSVYNYLNFLLLALALCLTLWVLSFISIQFFGKFLQYINYNTMWISIPLFIYGIGYYSLKQPEVFRVSPIQKSNTDHANRLKTDEIQKLQKRLNYVMEEERLFVQQNLTLKYLASRLDTTSNNLSWLLNQIYQESFHDYINRFRIDEFIKKVNQNEHETHTILALAFDVGFNSKSTFNRVFKSKMGSTPKEYLKTKKVA